MQLTQDSQKEVDQPVQEVTVYLRLVDSKTYKVTLPAEPCFTQIQQRVEALTGIPTSQQVLYCRGKELTQKKPIQLKDKAIIHVKTLEEPKEDITIKIIKHLPQKRNLFKLNQQASTLKVNPGQQILQFLEKVLKEQSCQVDLKRTKLVQCGRFLKKHKTFQEEMVQSQSEIHLIFRNSQQDQDQIDEEQDKFLIESLLKGSKHRPLAGHRTKIDSLNINNAEETQIVQEGQQGFLKENSLTKHNSTDDLVQFHSEEFVKAEMRRSLTNIPNYALLTQSFSNWQSQKFIRKDVNHLKFNLQEYKKYNGPKSVRECNCKRKDEFYVESEEDFVVSSDSSCPQSLSPSKSASILRGKKIKSLLTVG